jgi:hypothetical protein
MKTISRIVILALAVGLLVVPITEAKTRVYVRISPPIAVVEHPTPRPHANYVWQPGYHRWDGRAYVWSAGQWAKPPYRNAHWVEGRWARDGRRGNYWVPGHWSRR